MTSEPILVDSHATHSASHPNITLYTNHGCPWAHRAHIALHALKIPFHEVIIDLGTPRTADYLKINPRGLVPTINVDGEIIPESAIVAQYLADRFEGLEADSRSGALERARINFFVDAYISKVNPHMFGSLRATADAEKEEIATKLIDAIVKEVEPLLQNAKPFFNGSERLTLAEVQTGSFVLRLLTFPKHGLLPTSVATGLEQKAPAFWRWANNVVAQESVNYIWDEKDIVERTKARLAKAV